jgi:hypothetical protein
VGRLGGAEAGIANLCLAAVRCCHCGRCAPFVPAAAVAEAVAVSVELAAILPMFCGVLGRPGHWKVAAVRGGSRDASSGPPDATEACDGVRVSGAKIAEFGVLTGVAVLGLGARDMLASRQLRRESLSVDRLVIGRPRYSSCPPQARTPQFLNSKNTHLR